MAAHVGVVRVQEQRQGQEAPQAEPQQRRGVSPPSPHPLSKALKDRTFPQDHRAKVQIKCRHFLLSAHNIHIKVIFYDSSVAATSLLKPLEEPKASVPLWLYELMNVIDKGRNVMTAKKTVLLFGVKVAKTAASRNEPPKLRPPPPRVQLSGCWSNLHPGVANEMKKDGAKKTCSVNWVNMFWVLQAGSRVKTFAVREKFS